MVSWIKFLGAMVESWGISELLVGYTQVLYGSKCGIFEVFETWISNIDLYEVFITDTEAHEIPTKFEFWVKWGQTRILREVYYNCDNVTMWESSYNIVFL